MSKNIVMMGYGYSSPFTRYGKTVELYSRHSLQRSKDVLEEADILVFTGGEDLNPATYGEKHLNLRTHYTERDLYEVPVFDIAKAMQIPMVGICRGMQLFTAMHGGKLSQHVHNHATGRHHPIHTDCNKTLNVNSLHHQMCFPKKGTYELLAWAEGLSKVYEDIDDADIDDKLTYTNGINEPEALYFPESNALGVQYHPEMLESTSAGRKYFEHLMERFKII